MPDYDKLPPRIDASPEEIARAMFRAPLNPVEYREYRCKACGEVVEWPMVLFDDGRCELCNKRLENEMTEHFENLRGGTRREVAGLPPCKHCCKNIEPGQGYRTVTEADGSVELECTVSLYFDENAADLRDTLRELGGLCIVETLPKGTSDVDWLPEVGKNGWTAITQDQRIMDRAEERQALIDNNVKMFILPEEPRNSWDTLRGFAAMWPKIEVESLLDGPFAWKYHDDGHPTRWEQLYPPQAIIPGQLPIANAPIAHLLNLFADTVRWLDEGYYSVQFVDWIHKSIQKEIEAQIEGIPSGFPDQSEESTLSVDDDKVVKIEGRWTIMELEERIRAEDVLAMPLPIVDATTREPYTWLVPGRLMARYALKDGADTPKEIPFIVVTHGGGFQRLQAGMVGTRAWVQRPMRRAGLG